MERKGYLTSLVNKLTRHVDKELLLHLGHFAYDPKNHSVLLQLHLIPLLHSFLSNPDRKIAELSLGALCNLSSTPQSHPHLNLPEILSNWDSVSIQGQRSIACILFYTSTPNPGLESSDKVTNNILACLI